MTLSDLITRLEQATAGSRELDAAIWTMHDPEVFGHVQRIALALNRESLARQTSHIEMRSPHYTTSLDAALMLVPEGMTYQLWGAELPLRSRPGAAIFAPGAGQSMPGLRMYSAPTLALALCIAALKARQEMEKP